MSEKQKQNQNLLGLKVTELHLWFTTAHWVQHVCYICKHYLINFIVGHLKYLSLKQYIMIKQIYNDIFNACIVFSNFADTIFCNVSVTQLCLLEPVNNTRIIDSKAKRENCLFP